MTAVPRPPASEQGRLDELYQSVILDHNRRPRNHREMEVADARAEGRNPLCGDEVTVWVRLEGDTIADISFKGAGCAISRASASIMTTAVKGRTVADAEALFDRFHGLVTGQRGRTDATDDAAADPASAPRPATADRPVADAATLGAMEVFSGVSRFPVRVKCASLSWHTLRSALRDGVVAARSR
jgi:nitrogen fixation NifU-like protein